MKANFKMFDYVSFPADKDSDEVREGFIFRIRQNQIDVVSIRKKDGVSFADFGFHKKYLEKNRWEEVKKIELKKDITRWRLYQVVPWAMVRYYKSFGDFMTQYIKPHFEDPIHETESARIKSIVDSVRQFTIERDRKANRKG